MCHVPRGPVGRNGFTLEKAWVGVMNARTILVMLGLAAYAGSALASAQVTNEQRLQVGSVEMSLGAGLLNGQSQEKVYDSGDKVSQLNWDIEQVPTLHLRLALHPLEWLTLDARGWTRMSGGNSDMQDYDWEGDSDSWAHFSDHPDTRLKRAWQADVSATAWAIKRKDVAVGALAGYQHTRFDWQSRGGSYIYSSRYGYRDERGDFPAGEKANPQLSIKAGLELQVYAEAKGYANIHEVDKGRRSRTEHGSSSQSSRTTMSSLALAYQF